MSNETKTETQCRCGNCGWTGPESGLRCGLTEIEDFWSRVSPGDVVPDGECPECGGLAVPFDEANARLIAAAPELLAALQAALASLTDLANDWPVMELHEPISETIERARAVLASLQQSA